MVNICKPLLRRQGNKPKGTGLGLKSTELFELSEPKNVALREDETSGVRCGT